MRADWIETRLTQIGKSKSQLAKALKLPPPRVTELIKGERRIQINEVVPLAMFLELPTMTVIERSSEIPDDKEREHIPGMDPIYIKRFAEAGVWTEEVKIPYEDTEYIFAPAPTEKYSELYGLRVRGDSMNRVFKEGTILMVVPLFEYYGEYGTGLFVICRRSNHEKFETTVKELEVKDNRYWLWPRSTNPDHQQPFEIGPPEEWSNDDSEVDVIAVVISSYKSELLDQ